MARKLFGPGAHGGIVEDIQRALLDAGHDPSGIDGSYGAKTRSAVESFQREKGLEATGIIDEATWRAFMQGEIPAMGRRTLELTATFEGHGYSLVTGNWDGAWLTWGIIGFTMKFGKVQKIILSINQRAPDLIREAFGDRTDELLTVMKASPSRQEKWANSISVGARLAEPWRTGFHWLGQVQEVQREQRQLAREEYYLPALETSKRYGLKSELGAALCFDIHVQNGGIKRAASDLTEILYQAH